MVGKKCVPESVLTLYGFPAPPSEPSGPFPPSHVLPPSNDATTYMSYSRPRLSANAKYGLPWLSRVKAAKGVDVSWPIPPSKAIWVVQELPRSSDQATHSVWNVSSMVKLQ